MYSGCGHCSEERRSMKNSGVRIFLGLILATLLGSSSTFAQTHSVSVADNSVLPGGTVDVSILLTNEEGARGFSMGVAHYGTDLTLIAKFPLYSETE